LSRYFHADFLGITTGPNVTELTEGDGEADGVGVDELLGDGSAKLSSRSKLMSLLLVPLWWISTAITFTPVTNSDGDTENE
jgi:hypothetical protein